jgi:hypothetical protein
MDICASEIHRVCRTLLHPRREAPPYCPGRVHHKGGCPRRRRKADRRRVVIVVVVVVVVVVMVVVVVGERG